MADLNTNAVFTVAKANSSTLSNVPITNGQMILVDDTRQIYFDYNDIRQYYCQPIRTTKSEAFGIAAPAEAYYYFTDENTMFYYEAGRGWQQLTPSNLTPVIFDTLPETGKDETLYVDGQSIKR